MLLGKQKHGIPANDQTKFKLSPKTPSLRTELIQGSVKVDTSTWEPNPRQAHVEEFHYEI